MTERWRRILIGAALVAAASLLAFLFRNLIQSIFTRPLFYVYQFLEILYLSIPQRLLWLALVLAGGVITYRMLKIREPKQADTRRKDEGYRSRVEIWESWLSLASQGDLYRFKLTRELGDLGLQSLAFKQQITIPELWKHIRSGEMDMPDELKTFITAAPAPTQFNLFDAIQQRFLSRFQSNAKNSRLENKVENVVQFLESQLVAERNQTLEEPRGKSIRTD
jgi:hypothetical protein